MKNLLITLGLVIIIIACSAKTEKKPRYRRIKKGEAAQFHKAVELKIGWYPYNEQKMEKTGSGSWKISEIDSSDQSGMIPVIHVSNPDSANALLVYMDIDDALLGKLIKHSLMTEIPIEFPLEEYIQKADCMKCHPQNIDISNN